MSVPLLHEDEALGVLQVLDREDDARFGLAGDGAAGPVRGAGGDRAGVAAAGPAGRGRAGRAGGEANDVARLAAAVDALGEEDRETALALLRALERLLNAWRPRGATSSF